MLYIPIDNFIKQREIVFDYLVPLGLYIFALIAIRPCERHCPELFVEGQVDTAIANTMHSTSLQRFAGYVKIQVTGHEQVFI